MHQPGLHRPAERQRHSDQPGQKGCWRDNVFVERLWKSIKYEEVYLHAYDRVRDAKRGLEKYFKFYNQNGPHSALDDKTPEEFYFDNLPAMQKAAQVLSARFPLKKWKNTVQLCGATSAGAFLVLHRNCRSIWGAQNNLSRAAPMWCSIC